MSVQYVMPIPIYSVECIDNVNEIQQEIDTVARGIGFKHSEGWGQTHYLSDPTFKENFIEDNKHASCFINQTCAPGKLYGQTVYCALQCSGALISQETNMSEDPKLILPPFL